MRLALTAWLTMQIRKLGGISLCKQEIDIDEHALLYQANFAPVYIPATQKLKTKS